jgi:triosephosphate isomerase
MSLSSAARRLLAVNLKAYLGAAETAAWVGEVARRLGARQMPSDVEIAVLPSYPMLAEAERSLAPVGVGVGAQDVSAVEGGPHTGEVPAGLLAELGCRYVAVGHAERRLAFGESDALVAAKAAAAVRHGLVPIICVGESDHGGARAAADQAVAQTLAALAGMPAAEVVVAYEPIWAIGAAEPADADYVLEVGAALREELDRTPHDARVLYGGSAGPGTLAPLAARYDGLFLGRRAHQVDGLLAALDEAASADRPVSDQGASR